MTKERATDGEGAEGGGRDNKTVKKVMSPPHPRETRPTSEGGKHSADERSMLAWSIHILHSPSPSDHSPSPSLLATLPFLHDGDGEEE